MEAADIRQHRQGRQKASYLFVPGNRPERFAKACGSGAHAVIADLEDAVAPPDKPAARAAVAAGLPAAQPVYVRVNGADTEWFRDDVEMCRTAGAGIAGIMLPKAERVEDLAWIASRVGAHLPLLPLIETAQGMWHAEAIARQPGVERLAFGSIDFQVDLGIQGDDDGRGEELLHFRSQLVLVSRVAGIMAPVDGVTTAIDDAQRLRDDAARAHRLGFGGKLCIHPRQVELVNACFRPSEEEADWARRVLELAAGANGAAVAVDGKMVDKPVLLRAQAILARL
ncbi:HpcH/HpaI aldolase/citrate lyase family protein [Noviherbaspirillum aerium]|uniref:HpcH/HpaI aldolase/citrate lyase family protein n=1 Tax=Noviherbaspirillum aerium TaxID=2588497 RepID=UPI00124EC75A|nr:CoA ester lyase [Noviherbaspirillum aerium]